MSSNPSKPKRVTVAWRLATLSFEAMAAENLKATALKNEHTRLGAKLIPFGGWLMPVHYSSIVDEHQTVRSAIGVFDISHMGQLIASGQRAGEWLNIMLTNDVEKLVPGTGQYTFLLNDQAGVIDDLIVYRIGECEYLLVINASKIDEDFAWLQRHSRDDVDLRNRSSDFGGVAVQGPRTVEFFQRWLGSAAEIPPRNHIADFPFLGNSISVARTGYTGEDGFEVFFPLQIATEVWREILRAGAPLGIKPCGLGARDTLRLEMCYPLNGADLSSQRNPIEAGLGGFVNLEKQNFVGREKLLEAKREGLRERLIAFRMKAKGPPPRPHYAVFSNGLPVGEITSGTLSPSLNIGIGLAYVSAASAKIGTPLEIEVRGQRLPATVEKKPLYKKT